MDLESRYQNVSILDFIEAKDDESGGGNCSYKTYKAQAKLLPSTYRLWSHDRRRDRNAIIIIIIIINIQSLRAGGHTCRPTNSVEALYLFEENTYIQLTYPECKTIAGQ